MKTFFEWHKATDPQSGCSVFMQEMADGRFAVQFDETTPPFLKTRTELLADTKCDDFQWVKFELLRRHLLEHSAVIGHA